MTHPALALILGGAVGAMAFGAVMVYVARRNDFVALSLGIFLACLSASLLLGGDGAPGQRAGVVALPFLAWFCAALRPGAWARRAALASGLLGATAAAAGWLALAQGLSVAVAAWAAAVSVHLVRERRSAWPLMIGLMALVYPLLALNPLHAEGFDLAGFVAFVVAPGVVLTRRAIRAFDAEARRSLDQAKFAADVFDSVPVALSMRDLQGRYVFVNRTWEKYYRHRRESVIGTSPRERASTEEADRLFAMDKAALDAGPGNPTPPADFELAGRRYLQTRTAMADSQGKLLGVLIASIDTTERYAIEQALALEQRRLQLVVRAGNVGILDWDGVKRSVYYSPRFKEILRYPRDADASGWPDYFDMVHPEDKERVHKRFREHIVDDRGEELHEPIQYRLRCADGGYVWIEAVGASVRGEKGFATRFIASIADISERRAQEEALRQSVRLREEVERMSRHDLKTPLDSVIAMSRLLRKSRSLDPDDAELLASIERAGYRILNMVNLSLDLFRMESGTYQFNPQAVDIAAVARRVAADLESQAASKNVDVRVRANGGSPSSNPVMARADELLCYSLFANLVKNAIEAAPQNAVVSILVNLRGGEVLARVHNAGAVPAGVRERFFQKYATAGKSAGLGLGAYSARLMARVQGGEVGLESSEAAGTTLTVRLKAAEGTERAAPGEAAALAAAEAVPAALPPLRVLVVDDDEFNRLVLRRTLPSPPLVLAMAVNGHAALEAAAREWPDVVLLDLEMPVMDGYEAARRLREMEAAGRGRCKIIAISSNDERATMLRALEAGCDEYLVKPAPRETLLRMLSGSEPRSPAQTEIADPGVADPVFVDPDLAAVLPAFLASRRELLAQLPRVIAAGERAAFGRLAHKLGGSFALYGFAWAAQRCRELARDAAAGDAAELERRAAAVREHLAAVEVRVERAGAGVAP